MNNQEITSWLNQQQSFENIPDISIVIPAYNEEKRLPPTLIDMIDYCEKNFSSYEIIVVDDGSKDKTAEFVNSITKVRSQVKLIRLPKNYGKGHAVKTGILNTIGKMVLFADADGSTPIIELEKLVKELSNDFDIVIASRAIRSINTEVKTRFYRKLIGRVFNFFVNTFLLPKFADTQCGFKLFTRFAADTIFPHQQANQFSFDIEILYIAKLLNLKIKEVPINWINVSGSKVNLVFDSTKMFFDIFKFRFLHKDLKKQNSNLKYHQN